MKHFKPILLVAVLLFGSCFAGIAPARYIESATGVYSGINAQEQTYYFSFDIFEAGTDWAPTGTAWTPRRDGDISWMRLVYGIHNGPYNIDRIEEKWEWEWKENVYDPVSNTLCSGFAEERHTVNYVPYHSGTPLPPDNIAETNSYTHGPVAPFVFSHAYMWDSYVGRGALCDKEMFVGIPDDSALPNFFTGDWDIECSLLFIDPQSQYSGWYWDFNGVSSTTWPSPPIPVHPTSDVYLTDWEGLWSLTVYSRYRTYIWGE